MMDADLRILLALLATSFVLSIASSGLILLDLKQYGSGKPPGKLALAYAIDVLHSAIVVAVILLVCAAAYRAAADGGVFFIVVAILVQLTILLLFLHFGKCIVTIWYNDILDKPAGSCYLLPHARLACVVRGDCEQRLMRADCVPHMYDAEFAWYNVPFSCVLLASAMMALF